MLHVHCLKGISFETVSIECCHWERSMEESFIEINLAGVSCCRVEDITEAMWDEKVPAFTSVS